MIPWRMERQPTPVFLPGESHGQRSLAGYGPRGHKELEMTEGLSKQAKQTERDCKGQMLTHKDGYLDLP